MHMVDNGKRDELSHRALGTDTVESWAKISYKAETDPNTILIFIRSETRAAVHIHICRAAVYMHISFWNCFMK